MEAIRIKFINELFELKHLINFYNLESKLLRDFSPNDSSDEVNYLLELSANLKIFSLSKRQFNYKSIIISLYGSFERFIENCLTTYTETLNKIILHYNKLPEAILKNHYFLSLDLLNKVEQPKYSGPLKKEDIIKNLHTCININEGYQINKEAFAQHTSNFRSQTIDDSFKNVGIPNISRRILGVEDFQKYLKEKFELTEDSNLNIDESLSLLNELAERRNDVAHGVPSEILSNEILIDYINFFEKYANALLELLNNELLRLELEENGISLGDLTDVFSDGKVICVFTKNVPIRIGDTLIGENSNQIIKTKILGIKLNDNDLVSIDDQADYEIGILLENKFKKNFKVYLLK